MSNTELHTICFQDLDKYNAWGYGRKRIGIKIQGTITDKVPFSGFGFKEEVIDLRPIRLSRILHFFYWRIL